MSRFASLMALRYLKAKKNNRIISLVSAVSVMGIGLGIAAIIIAMSILNGFESAVTERLKIFSPDYSIENIAAIKSFNSAPGVQDSYRTIKRRAIIQNKDDNSVVQVRGVDLTQWPHKLNDDIMQFIGDGSLGRINGGLPGIVIGRALSEKLLLSIGDTVKVLSPLDYEMGRVKFPQRHFLITGLFKANIFDYDKTLAVISYGEALRLFRNSNIPVTMSVHLRKNQNPKQWVEKISEAYSDMKFVTWIEENQTLYSAMKMEKWASFFGLNLIILVAVFNIAGSLIMLVLEKTNQIGILRVMGASTSQIKDIFQKQGLIIASIGMLIGTLLGVGFVWAQTNYHLISLPSSIYFIPYLPVKITTFEVFLSNMVAGVLVYFAVRYPAQKAALMEPVEALRYKQ
jgi:lipoprotein-releasing system permease protein